MLKSTDKVFSPNLAIDAAKAIHNAGKAPQKHQDENTDARARHIFREFIPASVLNRQGYRLEYSEPIDGKTPDWLDMPSRLMLESYTYERSGKSSFNDRVVSAVATKCATYSDIISAHSLRFIVSVYIDFLTAVLLDQCYEDRAAYRPLFDDNESLWGILFFTEGRRGIPIAGTPYEFFCLTANDEFNRMPEWKLGSDCVYNDFTGSRRPGSVGIG